MRIQFHIDIFHWTIFLLLCNIRASWHNVCDICSYSLRHIAQPLMYNLLCRDYPDFYNRLYALLEPRVLSEKYMERFMYLLDMFLLSTYVC